MQVFHEKRPLAACESVRQFQIWRGGHAHHPLWWWHAVPWIAVEVTHPGQPLEHGLQNGMGLDLAA